MILVLLHLQQTLNYTGKGLNRDPLFCDYKNNCEVVYKPGLIKH